MFIFNLFKVAFCSELQFLVCLKIFNFESTKGRTIRKVKGGGGGGGFSAGTIFFFRALLVQEYFFQVKPPARIFLDKYCSFLTVKS